MRFASWITKAKSTRSEYVISTALPTQQRLSDRSCVTLHIQYIACLVYIAMYDGLELFVLQLTWLTTMQNARLYKDLMTLNEQVDSVEWERRGLVMVTFR
jgi:hypothetical protein